MRGNRWAGTAILGISLGIMGPFAAPTFAQTRQDVREIDIPAQNAADALDRFVRETKFEVVYTADAVRGRRTNRVHGRMSPRDALAAMLAGTGLELVATSGGGMAIRPIATAAAEAPESKTAAEDIVVTGTRLGKEFAGASPVQTIDRDKAAAGGLLETAEILRTQPQVSGPRSQLRYSNGQSFGGDLGGEGAGTQTIALRGLDSSETLTLVNGRRVAAAGVEGVPRSGDLSLIPSGLIRSYEILTDAASPVYGTDAIAGIVNIKLREDFDTTTLYSALTKPQNDGGAVGLISLTTGKTFDRGFIGFGAEYRRTAGLRLRNVHGAGPLCPANYDRRADGSFSDIDLLSAALPGSSASACRRSLNTISGAFRLTSGDTYYATPGRTNIEVPGFSLPSLPGGAAATQPARFAFRQFDSNQNGRIDAPVLDADGNVTSNGDDAFPDADGNGLAGVDPQAPGYDLWRDRSAGNTTFISPLRQINLFAYGQYDLQKLGDSTAYFEASFNERRTQQRSIGGTLNPITGGIGLVVPFTNPTNPCGIETGGCTSKFYNTPQPADVIPFVRINGDGDTATTRIRQFRLVGGLKGDLKFLNGLGGSGLGFSGWRYDVSVNAGQSNGQSRRPVILKDRLALSLATTVRDPDTGRLICGTDGNGDGLPDDPTSCVPVNLFTPEAMIDHRLTPTENAYLFGELAYRTQVDLLQVTANISGNAIRLPAGSISWVLGAEYRRDGIDAAANEVGRTQNAASIGAFIDPGAKGHRTVKEVFGEVGIPLVENKPLIHSLSASLAGRVTNEQFSGTNATWSARGRYEPFRWLAFRGTYGTSFRSPNTYELFTKPYASAFPLTSYDPCVVPYEAQQNGPYNPALDTRNANTLARCKAAGVDPTALGLGFPDVPDAQVERGSALDDLKPERSTALTAGAVISLSGQTAPFTHWPSDLTVNLSASYYRIRIRDEIQLGDLQDVLNGCYVREGAQLYCRRIVRGTDGNITFLRGGFINGNSRKTDGIDFNANVTKTLRIGRENVKLDFDLAGNYELSILSDVGQLIDYSGTLGYPKLKMNGTAQVSVGKVISTWYTNFIGPSTYFTQFALPADNYPSCPEITGTTCTPVQRLKPYFLHNASVAYRGKGWGASIGVNNVFDTRPPRISAQIARGSPLNTIYGGAYDIFGRTFVAQIRKDF